MMAENFTKEFFEENRILKAIIHYAKRPSEGDLQELKKILQKTYNATDVVLEEHQNDDILGGYMLQIGNKVFDNTFKLMRATIGSPNVSFGKKKAEKISSPL